MRIFDWRKKGWGKAKTKIRSLLIGRTLIRLALYSIFRDRNRLFIDCGSNLGQGYNFFKKYLHPKWYDAILIEPNPNCMKVLKERFGSHSYLEFVESAAWIKNQKLKLFGLVEDNRGPTSPGASVISNHNSIMYESNANKAIEVDAFSLSELILEKAKEYDQIIVKLDIESSEYEVLKDLIKNSAAKYIKHLFVEFHSQYFKDLEKVRYRELEKDLIKQLKSVGVAITLWD